MVAVRAPDVERVQATLARHGLGAAVRRLGAPRADDRVTLRQGGKPVLEERRTFLRGLWSETTHAMQALRDDSTSADEEQAGRVRADDPGLSAHLTFDLNEDVTAQLPARGGARPRVAILREQGVNGQIEMAAAFDRAGFDAVDVHMTDLLVGRARPLGLQRPGRLRRVLLRRRARRRAGLGQVDPLPAARARSLRRLLRARRHLRARRLQWLPDDVGAQGDHPRRRGLAALRAQPQRSVRGAPGDGRDRRDALGAARGHGRIAHAHRRRARRGTGRVPTDAGGPELEASGLVAARYVDHRGRATERYPENPNGSFHGITGITTTDGRVTIFMPHPERVFRAVQHSWHPAGWREDGPWMRLFRNARIFVS